MKITRALPFFVAITALLAATAAVPPGPVGARAQRTVSIVGDSLVANREQLYVRALTGRGVGASVDGVGSRALRYGWQCKTAKGLFVYAKPVHAKCKREGLEALKQWRNGRVLGSDVVIALGTNDAALYPGVKTVEHLREARRIVGGRKIWIVTVRKLNGSPKPKQWNATAAAWCAADVSCSMIPWAESPAAGNRANYSSDGVHLTERGAKLRAEMIATVVVGP